MGIQGNSEDEFLQTENSRAALNFSTRKTYDEKKGGCPESRSMKSRMPAAESIETGIKAAWITAYVWLMQNWKGKLWKTFRSSGTSNTSQIKDYWFLRQGFWRLWKLYGREVEATLGIFIFSLTLNCCSRKYSDSVHHFQVRIYNSKEKITLEILEFKGRNPYNLFRIIAKDLTVHITSLGLCPHKSLSMWKEHVSPHTFQ